MNETTLISDDIQRLKGSGIEYLIDHKGNPIAKFYDGMLTCDGSLECDMDVPTLPMVG